MSRSDGPRLYLIAEVGLATEDLAAAIEAGDAACVLLRGGAADDETLRAAIDTLRPAAQDRDAAFLLEDRPELAAETGCDGVHLSGATAVKTARRTLGDDAIVGASCGKSRHEAILAAEAGADYVAFGGGPAAEAPEEGAEDDGGDAADPDLLDWWQAMMTLPCVAMGGAGLESAEALARAGADFVAVGRALWDHPQGPGTAARLLVDRLRSD